MNRNKRGLHPAERFIAPSGIQRGVPLSQLIGRQSVDLLAESMVAVFPSFDVNGFRRHALRGLGKKGLMQRAAHVAEALALELPMDIDEATRVLVAAFGPELKVTEGNGLAPFFYLPHSQFISRQVGESFKCGIWACYELTKRFTAEYCIRPYLVRHQDERSRYCTNGRPTQIRMFAGW